MPAMTMWGGTNIGHIRKNNEDAYALLPDLNLVVVADGMGGAACGEVAAEITVRALEDFFTSPPPKLSREDMLRDAIRQANDSVRAQAQSRTGCQGMGSTVVAVSWDKSGNLWIANVGDSRAYRWRKGKLEQLSYDQNVANELRTSLGFTEEQIRAYPQRSFASTRTAFCPATASFFAATASTGPPVMKPWPRLSVPAVCFPIRSRR
jgi:protein phosphatase